MDISEELINSVWEKGIKVESYNSDLYRKDACSAWMMRSEYGNADSIYGWQIDHILPQSKGGGDDLINLRPMQYQNNARKSDNYPIYMAAIASDENRNIEKETEFVVGKELQEQLAEHFKK